jgi:hypothetical protein
VSLRFGAPGLFEIGVVWSVGVVDNGVVGDVGEFGGFLGSEQVVQVDVLHFVFPGPGSNIHCASFGILLGCGGQVFRSVQHGFAFVLKDFFFGESKPDHRGFEELEVGGAEGVACLEEADEKEVVLVVVVVVEDGPFPDVVQGGGVVEAARDVVEVEDAFPAEQDVDDVGFAEGHPASLVVLVFGVKRDELDVLLGELWHFVPLGGEFVAGDERDDGDAWMVLPPLEERFAFVFVFKEAGE